MRKQLCILLLLCLVIFFTGCTSDEVPSSVETSTTETIPSDFPEGQRLQLKVTPGNGHGGMAIAVSGKGSIPHVTCVEDTWIFMDGNFIDLGEAIEAGLITVEEMDAYARLDAKNGFCRMEYASLNGLSLYVYHYDGFDIGSYYDVFEAPDGTKQHFQQFQIVTGNRYKDVGEYSVDYPRRAREDWGLSFEVKEATSEYLTISITQTGGQHFGELHIGACYDIKKDTGGHFMEEYFISMANPVPNHNRCIANEATTEVTINWPLQCGNLPDGEYTLNIFVEDHFDSEQIHPFTNDYATQQNYEINFIVGKDYTRPESVELISSPISTEAVVVRTGNDEFETVESVESVILTSAILNRDSLTIEFLPPEPLDTFDCLYLNMAQFYGVPYVDVDVKDNIFVTMNDGTRIEFFQYKGAKNSITLTPSGFIDFNNAQSVTLSDGTKLTIHNNDIESE